jgi:hypothetical protein
MSFAQRTLKETILMASSDFSGIFSIAKLSGTKEPKVKNNDKKSAVS